MGTESLPGVKIGQGVTLTPHPHLVPWSRKSRDIRLLPLLAVRPLQSLSACKRCTLPYFTKSSKQKPPLIANSSSVDQEIPRPLQFVCDLLRPKSSHYWGLDITRKHTQHRIPLDEWSSRRTGRTYTTHNKHTTQTSMPLAELEPEIPLSERPQTYALHCAAIGICPRLVWNPKFLYSDQAVCMLSFFWCFIRKFCMYSSYAGRDWENVSRNNKNAFKVRR